MTTSRVAVVTGGASGMGESTCRELGRRGHKVGVLDINGEAAQRVAEDLRSDGVQALGVVADVADRASVEEAFAKAAHAGAGDQGRAECRVDRHLARTAGRQGLRVGWRRLRRSNPRRRNPDGVARDLRQGGEDRLKGL